MRVSRHGVLLLNVIAIAGCASQDVEPPQATIRFGDLTLTRGGDAALLRTRIDQAVTKLCNSEADARGLPREFNLYHPDRCLLPMRANIMRRLPAEVRAALRDHRARSKP